MKGLPEKLKVAGIRSLRTRRTLEKGLCLTVEPGCYFVDYGLDLAKNDEKLSKYLNWDKVEEYKEVGGVRLEDVFVVTENGIELLSNVPRTVEQIEKCMAGLDWKWSFIDLLIRVWIKTDLIFDIIILKVK